MVASAVVVLTRAGWLIITPLLDRTVSKNGDSAKLILKNSL
jgi:hypothetical protein